MKSILRYLSPVAVALSFGAAAQAVQISGMINFTGGFLTGNVNLTTANNVLTFGTGANGADNIVTAGAGTGSFSGIADGTATGSPTSLTTNIAGNGVTLNPGPLVWTVGGFTFNSNSIFETFNDNSTYTVRSFGTITGGAFEPTNGVWNASFQTATGEQLVGSFSASSAGVPTIPDGGFTAALLGMALVAMSCFAKRNRL